MGRIPTVDDLRDGKLIRKVMSTIPRPDKSVGRVYRCTYFGASYGQCPIRLETVDGGMPTTRFSHTEWLHLYELVEQTPLEEVAAWAAQVDAAVAKAAAPKAS